MTTLTELIASVDGRLGNYTQFASFTGTGDGSTTTYKLDDAPIVASSESVVVNSVALTEDTSLPVTAGYYYLDDDTGWLKFGTAPTDGHTIAMSYRYKLWDDVMTTEEINDGIDYCFGDFYIVGYDDDTVTNSTDKDYALPPNVEKVIKVEYDTSQSGTNWSKLDAWEIRPTNSYQVTAHTSDYASTTTATTLTLASGNGVYVTIGDVLKDAAQSELVKVTGVSTDTLTITRGHRSTTAATHASAATWSKWNDKYIHFTGAPGAGYLRLTYQKRSPGLTELTDTLEYTAGLPARAAKPIILYACWQLMTQRVPERTRSDIIPRAGGEYIISPNQLIQAGQVFKMQLDSHLNRLRQRPIGGRRAL